MRLGERLPIERERERECLEFGHSLRYISEKTQGELACLGAIEAIRNSQPFRTFFASC